MENLVFQSTLTTDEIENNFAEFDFFEALIEALEEIRNHSKEKVYSTSETEQMIAAVGSTVNMSPQELAQPSDIPANTDYGNNHRSVPRYTPAH